MARKYDYNPELYWSDKQNRRLSKNTFHIIDRKIYINVNSYEQDLCLHYHEFYELIYVLRGSANHIINGETHSACMGDLFLLNYNTAHTLENMSSNYKMIVVSFLPEVLDKSLIDCQDANDILLFLINKEIFERKNNSSCIILHACAKCFETLLEELCIEYAEKDDCNLFIIKNLLAVILARIYRMASHKYEFASKDSLDSVMNYLDQNYKQQIKLDELAKVAMLSPSYLSAQFKIRYGTSISNYVNDKRIKHACRMIETTNMSVADIMESAGFNDAKFFYSTFKRITGMTPGEYRKSKKQQYDPVK